MPFNVGSRTIITDDYKLTNIADATGNYGAFQPNVTDLGGGTIEDLSFDGNSVYKKIMTAATEFRVESLGTGKTIMLLLDTAKRAGSPAVTGYTPTFESTIIWAGDEEPSWEDYEGWMITLVCYNGAIAFGSATGYNFT